MWPPKGAGPNSFKLEPRPLHLLVAFLESVVCSPWCNTASGLVQSGAIINQSELAHFGQISTTRMTQIMCLDNLAPDIQEEILFLPRTTKGRDPIKEADIRPIAKTLDWNKQRQLWNQMVTTVPTQSVV